jgi:hypothetical protein
MQLPVSVARFQAGRPPDTGWHCREGDVGAGTKPGAQVAVQMLLSWAWLQDHVALKPLRTLGGSAPQTAAHKTNSTHMAHVPHVKLTSNHAQLLATMSLLDADPLHSLGCKHWAIIVILWV